jgi:glycosyltransferase involved in cell wall biosynthesis
MVVWVLKDGEILPIQNHGRRMRTWLLADALLARGHRVTWWTSTFSHQRKTLLFDSDQVCDVQRRFTLRLLAAGAYDRNVSLRRYLHHRRLGHRFLEVAGTLDPPDAIVCAFPVIDLAYSAARYAEALRIPLVIDVRDLWPDTFLGKMPGGSQWLGRLLFAEDFRRARYACASADSLVSISQGCLDWALAKAGRPRGPADRVFHTGYPDAPTNATLPPVSIRPEWSGKVLFTFVGSFGSSYNLRSLCDVAEACHAGGDDHVHFVLAGDGDQYRDIVRRAGKLPNVTLMGWMDQEALRDLLRASDVGLAPLHSVRDAMPNKPYEYLSAGLPILSSLEGEMAALIDRYDVGSSYRDGDVVHLRQLVLALAGDPRRREICSRNARALYESRFRAEDIYAGYARHVEEVSGGDLRKVG